MRLAKSNLFDPDDCDLLVQSSRLPLADQIVVNFARTKQNLLNEVRLSGSRTSLCKYGHKALARQHLVERRAQLVQERLGCQDDERFAKGKLYLSPKQVHVVGRCARVGHDHVDPLQLIQLSRGLVARNRIWVFVNQLHEAFEASARILWPHAFVSVREQHNESALPRPLGLTRRYELIDNDLGRISEVAELGFPNDQRVRARQRIAQLKPEYGELRQRAIAHRVLGLAWPQVVQWHKRVQVARL